MAGGALQARFSIDPQAKGITSMKMKLVRDDDRKGKENFGKKGTEVAGPEVWRFAFPCKGCLARPIDSDANARIEREIALVDPATRSRLVSAMQAAGTLPATVEPPAPAPVPESTTVVSVEDLEKIADGKPASSSDTKKK